MSTDNQQDELIFDFLEGNLSVDEEEAFTILKDESELFSREVRLWQNTYVEEALPNIEALEKKLLIRAIPDSRSHVTRIYMMFLILFVCITIQADQSDEFIPEFVDRNSSDVSFPVQEINESEFPSGCKEEADPTVIHKVKHIREITGNDDLVTSAVRLSDLKLNPLIESGKPGLQKVEIRATISQPASVAARKKWSQREMRLIRKKRWQDKNVRQANEFQKGRVPYVVPLNSSNF